jgi:rhodanese-related sulfurtransferase
MLKNNINKIFLMMTLFVFLIIAGGCGGGGGGDKKNTEPTPPVPTLSSLLLSSGVLSPTFSPKTTQYTSIVENTVTSITVTPTTAIADVSISINGMNITSGSTSAAINLNVGSNTISVVVENSVGSTTYTLTVTRASLPVYRKISAEKAHEMMAQSTGYIILDVRTDADFKNERIHGAILIPHDEIKNLALVKLTDKNRLIFVYCQTGIRSEIASRALVELGYSNVYDIGGIEEWKGKGYETEGDPVPYWAEVADTLWWDTASQNSSFTITTARQFAGFARLINGGMTNFAGKTINLANDIDLAGRMWDQISGAGFQGIFDGGGNAISNVKIFSHAQDIGLFGIIGTNGTIKNLKLTSVDMLICPT